MTLLVCLLAGSCGPPSRAERKETAITHQKKVLPGQYTCSLEAKQQQTNASCAITKESGRLSLLLSSQTHQLRGSLTATDAGFRFVGSYNCGQGNDCKESIETDFFQQREGQYQAVIAVESGSLLNITLVRK